MRLFLAIIVCFLLIFLFWFTGHIITKKLKVKEDNQLLYFLMQISLGTSVALIIINLISSLFKNFHIGLIFTLLANILLIIWQVKEFTQACNTLKGYFTNNHFYEFIKQNTDKYFWILIGVINFTYGLTAFSTTKLERFGIGNSHVSNINQLLVGNYPPKYIFLPNLNQKFHYGVDILAALFSQLTNLHPEVSLDILSIIFLNLSFLTFYALAIKFIVSGKSHEVNKYLVPFAAFLAWGPITSLFKKQPGESLPQKFLEKVVYLTQSRLISAGSNGIVIHWFFSPPQV